VDSKALIVVLALAATVSAATVAVDKVHVITRSIASVGSAKEAFERGYSDVLIIIRPKVSVVSAKYGQEMRVGFCVKYAKRRPPAPGVLQLHITVDCEVEVPYEKQLPDGTVASGYVRVTDYMWCEPSVIWLRIGENTTVWLVIALPENCPLRSGNVLGPTSVLIGLTAESPNMDLVAVDAMPVELIL